MATGALDANGIWQYGEDDSETTFSGLLNKLASSTSTTVTRLEGFTGYTGTLGLANGGTGSTTAAAAQTNLRVGLSTVIPTSATAFEGTVSVAADGLITFTSARFVGFNGVFTSAFNNYEIHYNIVSGTADEGLLLRFRNATSDDAGASDYRYTNSDYLDNTLQGREGSLVAQFRAGRLSSDGASGVINVLTPTNAATRTSAIFSSVDSDGYHVRGAGFRNTAKAFDGITFFCGGQKFTGTAKVFGFRN